MYRQNRYYFVLGVVEETTPYTFLRTLELRDLMQGRPAFSSNLLGLSIVLSGKACRGITLVGTMKMLQIKFVLHLGRCLLKIFSFV